MNIFWTSESEGNCLNSATKSLKKEKGNEEKKQRRIIELIRVRYNLWYELKKGKGLERIQPCSLISQEGDNLAWLSLIEPDLDLI